MSGAQARPTAASVDAWYSATAAAWYVRVRVRADARCSRAGIDVAGISGVQQAMHEIA